MNEIITDNIKHIDRLRKICLLYRKENKTFFEWVRFKILLRTNKNVLDQYGNMIEDELRKNGFIANKNYGTKLKEEIITTPKGLLALRGRIKFNPNKKAIPEMVAFWIPVIISFLALLVSSIGWSGIMDLLLTIFSPIQKLWQLIMSICR